MDECNINYIVQFSNRKTIGIIIKNNGEVVIKAPVGTGQEYIDYLLHKKERWIREKSEFFKNRPSLKEDEVMYLGKVYKFKVIEQKYLKRDFVCFHKDKFLINVKSQDRAVKALEKFFRNKCEEKVRTILSKYEMNFPIKPKEIKIKEQKSKWGCCTYDNRMFFNWKIIMARENAIEYVVIHEMCHMIEKNHSKKFWKEVEKIMPDYKKEDLYLKEKGYLMNLNIN